MNTIIKGTTSTGFEFEFDKQRVNNMEYLDALAEIKKGNAEAYSEAVSLLLSPEMKKALYDHVRTEDGRVPLEDIDREIDEILSSDEETKNS